ncbi:carboxymuconolactone decarboxylase family protein [Priestia filamentosa]|uniref:Carboxymuconolactone decarboxylase n=1 Tax=Priestia filamentosa TaxID=1402861 RepID=A0A1X7F8B1_9BACI|nr:carboxymuconolactone decarboxylase family protein [Priestia filamentosa]AKO91826.1 carboxymuconolactone decarboxylase [Priestia filamentosa]MDT3761969.1 carboxymuconolactone decarboxylase family protein [Priestia filamentosa]OXS68053.1 carboxymuconolactone decarboxylase family protein [Priestia filamentosa]WCM17057.1 carboxymuconolactone decarboxylase family protein [Priestia filamentosa]WRU96469.1 carboxymuconolactone decarboxylase family protein [Priestia filamentosa]
MSKGLTYFKEVYDVVPGWVQKMHDYSPNVLNHYTSLRSDIMQEGALTRKEKDILLVGMNAARLYERSMVYHTKGALDGGATLPELVEYLIVPYLYNGTQALKTGVKSLEYALTLKGIEFQELNEDDMTTEELLLHMIKLLDMEDTTFTTNVLKLVKSRNEELLTEYILSDSIVSKTLKYLLMVGIFVTELKGKQAGEWMEEARKNGASEAQLADVGFICLLTAGIPAWFEASDSLIEK